MRGRVARKLPVLRAKAVEDVDATKSWESAASLLKTAAKDPSVPAKDVFLALRTLQKARLPDQDWAPTIGCNKHWKLVYQADSKNVQSNMKNEREGTGRYLPSITAAQLFDIKNADEGWFKNGVFLGHVAAFQFGGPCKMSQKRLNFAPREILVKIGPWKLGPFKVNFEKEGKELPYFFNFFYVDDDIIAAQGKSGGIAFWAKTTPQFVLEAGLF